MRGGAPTAESVATWLVHLRRETERFAAVVGLGPLVTALQEVRRTSRCPSRTIPGTSPPG
jgi:hypothetical protein